MEKVNQYELLKNTHQEEFDKFPIKFAFTEKQFEESMKELGLTANDTDKVVGISNAGGFIRKTDVKRFNEMVSRFRKEEEEAIKNDETGEGYIKDMFEYELANHEYGYTYELADTLDALGLTINEINKNEKLKHGLQLALERYKENYEEYDEEME